MRNLSNSAFRWYYKYRYKQIEHFMKHPFEVQNALFKNLIQTASHTEWGKKHNYKSIKTVEDFRKNVPIQDYESHKPYITRMMEGESNVLWSGKVDLFSKSSGTTNDKSKFIPVSRQNFNECHMRGSWDTMSVVYEKIPDCSVFAGKNFLMGGNYSKYKPGLNAIYGDVSALMIRHMPKVARPFFEPNFDIVFQDDWETKIQLMAEVACNKDIAPQIRMVGGVPTWIVVFFRHILELSGKSNILEVWPNFEVYIHGGVSMTPYWEQFQRFLPSEAL